MHPKLCKDFLDYSNLDVVKCEDQLKKVVSFMFWFQKTEFSPKLSQFYKIWHKLMEENISELLVNEMRRQSLQLN